MILAVTILVAYFVKRLSSRMGLPIVTGYVFAGVLMGMSLMNMINEDMLDHLDMVNDFALALIGFTIGTELRREVFRELGKSIILIAIFESIIAFLLVCGVLLLVYPDKPYQAFIFGAVASATAPAATVYVIQQYKAKGPLTTTIMAVVGIDDAVALTIFVFATALAKTLILSSQLSMLTLLLKPVMDIGFSLILGICTGFVYIFLFRKIRFPDDLILGCAAFLLGNMGIASYFHLSGLLAVMAFGSVVTNMNPMLSHRSARLLENFSPILFACFFILGGAHLNINLLPKVGMIGLIYLFSRMAGKISGASLGAWLGKASPTIRKYVGLALIPQVGVAVALAIMVRKEFGKPVYGSAGMDLAEMVINVLLLTTVFTEVIGPVMTKWILQKSGEKGQADKGVL
ncbi:cation:proton antiporter [bacterium]|nr:cation:proton antiporter [bacterium]